MVRNGVHICRHEATGLQREEFCGYNSRGEYSCIIALVDEKRRVFRLGAKSQQKRFVMHVIGAC